MNQEEAEKAMLTPEKIYWLYDFTVTKGNIYSLLEAQLDKAHDDCGWRTPEEVEEIRREVRKEVGKWLEKNKHWIEEISSGRPIGYRDSTGGVIELKDTYYLIPKVAIEALKEGKKPNV